jgi:hypothetical protein
MPLYLNDDLTYRCLNVSLSQRLDKAQRPRTLETVRH